MPYIMDERMSHGWLVKKLIQKVGAALSIESGPRLSGLGDRGEARVIAAFLILIAALGVGTGVGLTLRWKKNEQSSIRRAQLTETELQNRLVIENIWSALELVRNQALELKKEDLEKNPPRGLILHWAEIQVKNDALSQVIRYAQNPRWKTPQFYSSFEEVYLGQAVRELSYRELKEKGVAVIPVRDDPEKEPKLLGVAYPSQNSVVLALVDPMQAFSLFKNWKSILQGRSMDIAHRAFLITRNGTVLAHTEKSYIATNLRNHPLFEKAFQTRGSGTFQSIDRLPTLAAYSRIGSLPIAAVTERVNLQTFSITLKWVRDVALAFFGLIALCMLMARLAIKMQANRGAPSREGQAPVNESGCLEDLWETNEIVAQKPLLPTKSKMIEKLAPTIGHTAIAKNSDLRPDEARVQEILAKIAKSKRDAAMGKKEPAEEKSNVVVPHPELQAQMEELQNKQEDIATQRFLQAERAVEILIDQFQDELQENTSVRVWAEKLTSTAGRICKSPTLYFSYQVQNKLATLTTIAGFKNAEAPRSMTFPIVPAVLDTILRTEAEGKQASLAEYSPLAKMIMSKMGIAHFEAWPVTGRGKLQGVLVILQPGTDSNLHRGALNRTIQIAGKNVIVQTPANAAKDNAILNAGSTNNRKTEPDSIL